MDNQDYSWDSENESMEEYIERIRKYSKKYMDDLFNTSEPSWNMDTAFPKGFENLPEQDLEYVNILGYKFYIEFDDGEDEGRDQYGNIWYGRGNPVPNKVALDCILDHFNLNNN